MIGPDSRYVNDRTIIVTDERGTHTAIELSPPTELSFSFTSYLVRSNEYIDGIAHDFYGDGRLWWLIARANPEIIDWHQLPAGTVIRIPSDG